MKAKEFVLKNLGKTVRLSGLRSPCECGMIVGHLDSDHLIISFPNDEGWEVVPDTVGQFTGLLDKNGKEIYEGDLSQDKLGRISVCEFHHGGYWIRTIETLYNERLHSGSQMDVVGNIHDNPELLKGGEE